MKRSFLRTAAAAGCAALLAIQAPFCAFAQQSPDFARTEEEWARLRDDDLEFDEIPALIHEYNSTVLQNAIDYKNDRGKTSTDIAESYYEAAEDINAYADYPDSDSPNYASGVTSYLNSMITYERLMTQGDNNTNDGETIRLSYEKTEAELARQAQDQMISWWSQSIQLDSLRARVAQAQSDLNAIDLRIAAGTATAASRTAAEQTLLNAQASLSSAESSLAAAKENLILMMGWTYGADVHMGALPEPDLAAIAAVDLAGDIARAKENNYSLRSLTRQVENAQYSSSRETLEEKKRIAEENIANSVSASYNALTLAQSSWAQANESVRVQQTAMDTANRRRSAGTITQNTYNQLSTNLVQAQVTAQVKKLDLLKAWIDYNWAVNGLAST